MRSKGAKNVCKERDYDVLWKFSWVKTEVRYVREERKATKSWKSDRINRLDGEFLEIELLECPKDLEQKGEKLSNMLL